MNFQHKGTFESKRVNNIYEYGVYGKTVKHRLYAGDKKERYFHLYHSISKESAERAGIENRLNQMTLYLKKYQNKVKEFGPGFEKYFNLQYTYTTPIIFDNYRLNSQVQICLENYLIGICSLESLYKKINIDILGVSKEEYKTIIDRIEQLNIEIVQTFRTIFSNIDFIMRFQEYCADKKRKQSKESGEKREFKRTKAVVDQFFRNVEHFCKDYIKKDFKAQLNCLILQDSKGKQDELVRLALNESLTKKNMLSLEARICPKNTSAKLIKNLKKYKRIVKSEPVNDGYDKLIYVLHFPKLFDRPFKDGVPRNNNVRKMAARQARSIVAMLDKNGEINQHIKGIDACSSEIACRPEVFGQIYRYLTAKRVKVENASRFHNCEDVQNLQMTYHVGEDFFDIIDGLRAIDEVLLFCNYRRGSRLGHALALGISPEKYYAMKGYKVALSKQILLDDIVWLYCRSGELGCSLDEKLKTNLIEKYTLLYKEIYENNVGNGSCPSIHEYYQSWKLRGDNPQCYRLEEKEFNAALETTELVYFDRFRFNPRVDNNLRRNKRYRDLYYYYHFNKKVREKGNEVTEFKVTKEYIKLVRIMQDKMIAELACKGIGIETNPSSNYLIGTIKKYEEHPILRFNSRKLKATNTGENLCVSINTDDQGVFDTLLENEYALMTLALKKATDDDMNALYDIEDIYEWSDYVRRMGIDQVFS